MKRFRTMGAVAVVVAVSMLGMSTTAAAADPADDAAIMIENLPAAVDALVAGVQEAADTLAATQSAEATAADLGQALVDAGSALVQGTEQFGALGLGFLLINNSVQQALEPFLQAIDDPATAGDLVDPDDLTTILDNLQPAIDVAQPQIITGLIQLLEGDVYNGLGNTSVGVLFGAQAVLADTILEALINPVAVVVLVVLIAGGTYLTDLGEQLAPVFEALAPVTEPVIAALQGL